MQMPHAGQIDQPQVYGYHITGANDDGTVNVMNLHEVARTNAGDLACCIGKPKKTHENIEKRKA